MPLNLSPKPPSSLQTLRALRDLKHLIFRDNPCVKKTGICVYLSRNARVVFPLKSSLPTKRRIEKNYLFEVIAVDSFLPKAKWASVHKNCRIFPSDGYVCHGSISNGSGRSVFVKNHQIKGVGRTVHACFHHFHHGFNGAMSLREAFREAYFEKVLARILDTPPIPIDFILIPKAHAALFDFSVNSWKIDDVRCVLGRRGSPLRISHIHYLQSALHQVAATERKHEFLNLLASQFNRDPEILTSKTLRDDLLSNLRRAAILCAEMRVFGLNISLWADNCDLFSRVFDVGETRSSFPHIDLKVSRDFGDPRVESPVEYLLDTRLTCREFYQSCLYPIKNQISIIRLIFAELLDVPRKEVEKELTWRKLNGFYEEGLRRSIERMLGVPVGLPGLEGELAQITRFFPLVGPSLYRRSIFDWDELLRGYWIALDGAATGSKRSQLFKIGLRIGTAVRLRSPVPSALKRVSLDFCEELRGKRIHARQRALDKTLRVKVISPYLRGKTKFDLKWLAEFPELAADHR